jgi:hypothetical protein
MTEEARQAATAAVLNKVRPLIVRPALRGVLGQAAPKFDLASLFNSVGLGRAEPAATGGRGRVRRPILLVNLAKGLLGPESAQLLGTLLLHQLWQTALGRAALPAERRHPVMLFVDELPDYLGLPTSFAEVLAQARGLGVGLHVAYQHLGQLPNEARAAVLANARTRVVFQTSSDDAALLVRGQPEVSVEDITHLERREVLVRLSLNHTATPYMSGRTLPPPPVVRGAAERVRKLSRATWGVSREQTDRALRELAGERTSGGPSPVGTVRRSK